MKQIGSLLLLALGAATLAAADDHRQLKGSHEITAGQAVHIDFPAGELEIEAAPESRVEIELEVECKWRRSDCRDLLDGVEIVWRARERRLFLEIEGLATWRLARLEVSATVKMPARAALDVEMGAGRLLIDGLTNDVRVDMGAGEIRLWMPESAVESVSVDVGVGDAKFQDRKEYVSGRRSLLIGSELHWDDGPGEARIDIELGAGEATVWLD